MKLLFVLLFNTVLVRCNVIRQFLESKDDDSELYAVLTGGSTGIRNLFSETSVCLMYHILRKHGVKDENIITFAGDDNVNSTYSPWPGELRPQPGDPDVRQGCRIDYSYKGLNFDLFAEALIGNDTGGIFEHYPVLKSTSKDRVLLYHSSHGDSHEFEFGREWVQADRLQKALTAMHEKGMYKQLLYAFETCYSGSMFVDWLTPEYNILAYTASNPNEYAYGTSYKGWLLSGEFSCHLENFIEKEKDLGLSLSDQFEYIKSGVNKSEVCKYGNFELMSNKTNKFFGSSGKDYGIIEPSTCKIKTKVSLQEADFYRLQYEIEEAEKDGDTAQVRRLNEELQKLHSLREHINEKIDKFVNKMVTNRNFRANRNAKVDLECYGEVSRTFRKHCHYDNHKRIGKINYDQLHNLCHSNVPTQVLAHELALHCLS
ncbi:unnamed protein product [Bursaphelenchus okinawaensis]|uniref:Legumain n=1 Tax=Bursaphelenchus okinawaensis TaxID=465554 RepID=A0A811LV11_9BILA|nr:unnamed protein product [Bursaphelenchus okinawaensis]CAG9128080.1 unnamed protein product [Bursaphelenchus okinawaensis]